MNLGINDYSKANDMTAMGRSFWLLFVGGFVLMFPGIYVKAIRLADDRLGVFLMAVAFVLTTWISFVIAMLGAVLVDAIKAHRAGIGLSLLFLGILVVVLLAGLLIPAMPFVLFFMVAVCLGIADKRNEDYM